ncbi:hypothetical protein Bca52824_002485 [Brassica carinata]|uniref:Methenyltetrahydrofolate cyclohydrolase n=1 Tax=Brassica carinata TaxID=52824 RepID=A0A8X7WM53_BRACI|nr:hypothetical protein Bca52824_002485 [Brassica carinata]
MASLMFTVSTSPLVHVHRTPATVFSFPAGALTKSAYTTLHLYVAGKSIIDEIKIEVARMDASIYVVPGLAVIFFFFNVRLAGLAVILVGDREDSASYVRNKKNACESVGIKSVDVCLPEDSSEEEVLKYVLSFNNDPSIYGILVQLPLPSKDVDGFHPFKMGLLAKRGCEPDFVPCTPKGCIEKRAVVIGRSNIVGMPVSLLLQNEDATVTTIHSKTKNPEEITREADILIAAAGRPNMVRGSWIKPGAVVIDVGINHVQDPNGSRLVGDVCHEEACKVASAITPVPGGVGPMTIAMLLSNTLTSAKRIQEFQ